MDPASNPRSRAKLQSRACEACRVAKVRCQPGPQSDTCKRCSSNKKECVFRTGPRSRRSKAAVEGATPAPPPQGPSQSFTINFAAPDEEDPASFLEDIEKLHESAMDGFMPLPGDGDGGDLLSMAGTAGPGPGPGPTGSGLGRSPSAGASRAASCGPSRSLHALGLQPQFNLLSAQKLLDLFRDLLPHCPLLVLPERADVKSMAKESPFLLLAILAAASCSVSLQGHGLYDEEFRKVLGLKFVTGSERSLELLQGVLIYLMWYPHYLRPKSAVRNQYVRIAVDIVRDLSLDQETAFADRPVTGLTHEDMQGIRAFLACFYLASTISNGWQRPSMLPPTQWVMRCCDLLEQHSPLDQDCTLVWLARLGHTAGEMLALHKRAQKPNAQDENQLRLLHLGLEAQLQEWQARMPATVAARTSIKLALVSTVSLHAAAPLVGPKPNPSAMTGLLIDATRLTNLTHALRVVLDAAAALTAAELNRLGACDWGHLVLSIILALRLSFPVQACPLFDAARARAVLGLGDCFDQLGRDGSPEEAGAGSTGSVSRRSSRTAAATTPSTENGDAGDGRGSAVRKQGAGAVTTCASAFRVILRSIKAKYEDKVAAIEAQTAAAEEMARASLGCPMMDGSLADYLPLWDVRGGFPLPDDHPSFPTSGYEMLQSGNRGAIGVSAEGFVAPAESGMTTQEQRLTEPLVFDDLWATMAMGWAADNVFDLGSGAEWGQSELP